MWRWNNWLDDLTLGAPLPVKRMQRIGTAASL
jgi:hypothetical protein